MLNGRDVVIRNVLLHKPSCSTNINGDEIASVMFNVDETGVTRVCLNSGENFLTTCPITMFYKDVR